jgi:phage major head subunit gpT-like protein
MLVNKTTLTAVFVAIKTIFNKAFSGAPSQWEKTCTKVPSGTGTENYDWIDAFPKMREWVGDKVIRKLKGHEYSIKNKPYEATVEVKRDDLEDNTTGLYSMQAQSAGQSAKQWPDELTTALKNNAFTGLCYDGQYFYDTDHPVGGSAEFPVRNVSNKGTAPLSWASLALAEASYGAARLAIMSMTDDEGRPLALIPDTLEVPPALETTANALMNNEKFADDKPNPYKGQCKVVVNPLLTSATQWMLHCTSQPVKPFIFQVRKEPVFVSQTSMESEDVFMRGSFKFGVEARGNAGYGLWQMSYGSTGEG